MVGPTGPAGLIRHWGTSADRIKRNQCFGDRAAVNGTASGVSGIGATGPFGRPTGPTGAGATGLMKAADAALKAKAALTVDAVVVRGRRTAGFIVPSLGEKVLSFLVTHERLEEAIGDFEQGFRMLATRQGLPHAHRWYYWQVIKLAVRKIWPLISDLLKLGGYEPPE